MAVWLKKQLMPDLASKYWIMSKVVLAGLCQDSRHYRRKLTWESLSFSILSILIPPTSVLTAIFSFQKNKLNPKLNFLQMGPQFHQCTCLGTITQNCVHVVSFP